MFIETIAASFINHAKLAFNRNAGVDNKGQENFRRSISKNTLEKIGDGMVWHVTKGLRKLGRFCKDPRVVTVAMTALAMLALTFAFYPVTTFLAFKAATIFLVTQTPWLAVKAAAYGVTALAIMGTGVRMLGRVTNKELMDHFYASHGYRLNAWDRLEPLPEDSEAAEAADLPEPSYPKNNAISKG